VRGFTIETAGSLLAVPAIVGMAVVGPAGALIDRLGARRIILAGMTAQMLGNVLLAFSSTPLMAALALALLGAAGGVFWPGFNAMIGAVVPSGIRQRYFGINFTLVNLGIGIGGCWRGPSSTSIDRGRSWPSTSATRSASWRLLRCFSDPFDR
jgi:MFS family permease